MEQDSLESLEGAPLDSLWNLHTIFLRYNHAKCQAMDNVTSNIIPKKRNETNSSLTKVKLLFYAF